MGVDVKMRNKTPSESVFLYSHIVRIGITVQIGQEHIFVREKLGARHSRQQTKVFFFCYKLHIATSLSSWPCIKKNKQGHDSVVPRLFL